MKAGWLAGCIDYAENINSPTHEHTLHCEILAEAIVEERQADRECATDSMQHR